MLTTNLVFSACTGCKRRKQKVSMLHALLRAIADVIEIRSAIDFSLPVQVVAKGVLLAMSLQFMQKNPRRSRKSLPQHYIEWLTNFN